MYSVIQVAPGAFPTQAGGASRGTTGHPRVAAAGQRQPEAVPVDAQGHEVAPAHRGLARQRTLLGDVPDTAVAGAPHGG